MLRPSKPIHMKKFVGILLGLSLVSCTGLRSRYHTVEPGDSLKKLAREFDVSLDELEHHNQDLLAKGLKPGTKIFIPFESNPRWDAEYYEAPTREVAEASVRDALRIPFIWPVRGPISSQFGKRFMRGRGNHFHEGIDIAARKGTPVKAARSGHVVYAGNRISGYGNMIIVQHADKYSTVYAHLTKMTSKKGQYVARGQQVGTVGRTGRSTGYHLHFEVRAKRQPVDPMPFMFRQYARNP